MSLVETLELAPPVLFATFHLAEALAPAERLPRSFGWRAKGLLWFLISGAIFTTAPQLWTAAAALAGALGFFCACFQHANLRTPRWLGYVLQRPEAHSVHHARGVHAYNYADLPIFDMLFGTFKQAERREPVLGLFDGSARRVSRLLVGLDLKHENGAILRPTTEGN
jgi:sterol desaturase/sphingolipid hydroxylase (fatty acid hydroxylase superfamily)